MPELTKRCKDCPPSVKTPRPALYPGPRCATHHRMVQKTRSEIGHDRMVGKTYGLKPGEYERIYQAQGGHCAICGWATGRSKRLAVDHDHETDRVRGLLCSVCNRFIGYVRNAPAAFQRGYDYLKRAQEARDD